MSCKGNKNDTIQHMMRIRKILESSWMRSNEKFDETSSSSDDSTTAKNVDVVAILRPYWDMAIDVFLGFSKSPIGADNDLVDKWFQKVVSLHSLPDRKYHTLWHLCEMMGYIDLLSSNILKTSLMSEEESGIPDYSIYTLQHTSTPSTLMRFIRHIKSDKEGNKELYDRQNQFRKDLCVILLATFFHDAIYNPKSSTNEEDSMELFEEFVKDLVPKVNENDNTSEEQQQRIVSQQVASYIIQTKSHSLPESYLTADSTFLDLKMFLDIDMSVLSKSRKAYMSYANLIRQEYIHVPRDIYCEKRSEILSSFLTQKKSLFFSSVFQYSSIESQEQEHDRYYDSLEKMARGNLEEEIKLLSNSIIPNE